MGNNETREQLADILYKQGAYCGNCDYESRCSDCGKVLEGYAAAIQKAGWRPPPRRIETEGELRALPVGVVLLHSPCTDSAACVWVREKYWWSTEGTDDKYDLDDITGHCCTGTLTVLHTPEESSNVQ